MRVLYILWIHVLYKIYALLRFSLSLWLVSFPFEDHQKFLIVRKFSSSICSLINYAFSLISKKSLPILGLQNSPLIFHLRNFIVLGLIFYFMIHIMLVVILIVRYGSKFVLYINTQLFHHHLLKRLPFLHWTDFELLSKNQLYINMCVGLR